MFMNRIDTQDVKVARDAAGHDFEVAKVRLQTENGLLVPEHVGIMNQKNGSYLGTVGINWEPVQPETIYEIADELIQSTGGIINGTFDIRNGSVMGISFSIAHREYVAGDLIDLSFMMVNGFDGTHGVAGHATTYRFASDVYCNTSRKLYNLRHTKNVMNRIQVVKEMMKFYKNEVKDFDAKMTRLAGQRMSTEQAVEWFKSLFPKPNSERAETRLNNQVAAFIDCLHNGRGSNIVGVKGTAYGAFQALTEYVTYHRSTRVASGRTEEEVRFEAIHFGAGNTLNQNGLDRLTKSFTFDMDEFMIE